MSFPGIEIGWDKPMEKRPNNGSLFHYIYTYYNEGSDNMKEFVTAVRIYFDPEHFGKEIMADLLMSDGVIETIVWTDKKKRKPFMEMIGGYTVFYDERYKLDWDYLINKSGT